MQEKLRCQILCIVASLSLPLLELNLIRLFAFKARFCSPRTTFFFTWWYIISNILQQMNFQKTEFYIFKARIVTTVIMTKIRIFCWHFVQFLKVNCTYIPDTKMMIWVFVLCLPRVVGACYLNLWAEYIWLRYQYEMYIQTPDYLYIEKPAR